MGTKGTTKRDFWTKEDIDRVMHLRDVDKLAWAGVTKHFPGRTTRQVRARYHGQIALQRHRADPMMTAGQFHDREPADAVRRMPRDLPEHTSLTARVFGDPLPGRSALDRMRSGLVEADCNPKNSNAYLPLFVLPCRALPSQRTDDSPPTEGCA